MRRWIIANIAIHYCLKITSINKRKVHGFINRGYHYSTGWAQIDSQNMTNLVSQTMLVTYKPERRVSTNEPIAKSVRKTNLLKTVFTSHNGTCSYQIVVAWLFSMILCNGPRGLAGWHHARAPVLRSVAGYIRCSVAIMKECWTPYGRFVITRFSVNRSWNLAMMRN